MKFKNVEFYTPDGNNNVMPVRKIGEIMMQHGLSSCMIALVDPGGIAMDDRYYKTFKETVEMLARFDNVVVCMYTTHGYNGGMQHRRAIAEANTARMIDVSAETIDNYDGVEDNHLFLSAANRIGTKLYNILYKDKINIDAD